MQTISSTNKEHKKPRKPKIKDTQIPQSSDPSDNVADEVVHKELGDSLVRAATTASSLEAEQDSGGGPRCQETMGDTIAQTRFENVSKHSNDSLLARVLIWRRQKTTQHNEIASLKRRVKKLEKKNRSRTHRLKRLYKVGLTARVESSDDEESLGEDASKQGRIDAIDADEEITLVSAAGDIVSAASAATTVSAATTTTATITTVDDITLAQALEEMKSTKPKQKGVVIQELGKGILMKPVKKKDQILLDEETALNLQAEFDEEERLAREKAEKEQEANIALIETWDDIQAKIDVDHQLAERLQAQEQEELSVKEKATLFQQLLEKRRKHFAAKRAEEKRNKPPTKAQQRKIMCTYLKNMEGYKLKDLKSKGVGGSKEKRAGIELAQEITKKQKVEDDKETAEIKKLMEIILDEEEVAIDAIPLAVKSPSIVDWKIHKEGRKSYYQIIRADGKSQMYMIFSHMLKSFDREDLETLYKLVKAKYESTRPVEDLDLLLWGDLKTMFEPHIEDKVWRNQQDYKVLSWKLYDSCGVHFLRMQHMQIYMLVEKKYPLTPSTLTMMLEKKLMIDYESEMAYQLLKFIIKQLKNKDLCLKTDEELDRMSRVPYASAVGSIMYAMTCIRPDVSFALSMVSRHQQNPGEGHWTAVKNILKYLRNTKDMFLVYGGEEELRVTGYCDASWQTDKDDSRSQSGWVFLLNGGAVTWKSSKQDTVADSTCESEYIAACEASKEAIWMKNFIGDLGVVPIVQDPIEIFCDNESAVALTKEPKDHGKSKHIERKYHFVRSKVEEGHVIVKHIRSEDNPADPFTKALAKSRHDEHARSIGLKDNIKF
ncbi:putative ribonuclease H-like domain-containing protein [Tanacetum coccineum]